MDKSVKKILAIIPARGGSKGVKRKNIRSVGNKPLIYWSIKAAQSSTLITSYIVSTDDAEIKMVAESFGASVLDRETKLAEDKTPMLPVLQDVCLNIERKQNVTFDAILLLQPTAPMRTEKDIDSAIELFLSDSENSSLVSVYQVDDCHPSRMYRISENCLEKIYEEPKGSLRQDLEPIYHRNGAMYICSRDLLIKENKLVCDKPIPFIMSKESSANIDDEQDLLIADFLMKKRIEQ
ncbi:acylneuraminate cytidylyltransferase family protein [Enterovibrio makurazakiensis]|uniref:acylneuraminate cytidylyltransferase family protein n=1 Tax=Enterovibrio makurazakiensis TaxID=2910232 RepID=UPI003D2468E3